jgi:SSS family solute:Na+ symporter
MQWSAGMTVLDWSIVVAYGLLMVGVGWYYSRRTSTTEDYLLGGRRMASSAIGLSLFATLMSTLTYLATPGEMINKGPVILWCVFSTMIAYFIVGYLIIPHFMKLPLTSAYEILEKPLGLRIRLLASGIFVVARLMWMALIMYVTADKLIIVMMGWPETAVPYISLVMGLVTIVYTSMGGLKAVVWTGVVKSFILLGGAVLVVVLISVKMGGVGAWWPTEWSPSWDQQPLFSLSPTCRATVVGSLVFMLVWWVCTAGSDQMAIQRYLATRDAKAARRAFRMTCITDITVTLCLGLLGFALLGFFRSRPQVLADAGWTIARDADKLLPYYIIHFLPTGVRGMLVAGLLAAAMASLASGMNSSCSVISVDFIDRFRTGRKAEAARVRQVKVLSVISGLLAVGLSLLMSRVSGNVNELCVRINHIFVAPLFCLFFMALFVPFATSFGTGAGALAGCTVAVLIAYWDQITGGPVPSFQWISPLALVADLAVAIPLSWLTARGCRGRSRSPGAGNPAITVDEERGTVS